MKVPDPSGSGKGAAKGHAITYKRFICVRGLLNGIMLRCIEFGIIKNNPVMDIDYTSTRIENAAIVFDSGIRLEELSSMLGHTNTATTLHYIRRKEPDKNTAEIVRTVLTA